MRSHESTSNNVDYPYCLLYFVFYLFQNELLICWLCDGCSSKLNISGDSEAEAGPSGLQQQLI